MRPLVSLVIALFGVAGAAHAHRPVEREKVRRTTTAQLSAPVERFELANGLVAVLSPDPNARTAVVLVDLRAGAAYEPPGLYGLAHFTEHIMARGATEETDYPAILGRRGALSFGAFTSRDMMCFVTEIVPEELPLALWAEAERLGHLPSTIDAVDLEQHKKIVLAERSERFVDREYGLVDTLIDRTLFPAPSPLHEGVGGDPASIGRITHADVKAFVSRLFVPANASLIVTGRFDPAVVKPLIERLFSGIPGGARARPATFEKTRAEQAIETDEPLARQQRVSLTWKVTGQRADTIDVLSQGALLLTLSTDGAFGTRVVADVDRVGDDAIFRMDVTLPYEKPRESALAEADAFLRYLTMIDVDLDLLDAANLYQDRAVLAALDAPYARARLLGAMARYDYDLSKLGYALEGHWRISPATIQETARELLKRGKVVVYARPTRPRTARVERED